LKINNAIKNGITSFIIFSDDLPWCKANIKTNHAKIFFAEHTSHDYDDLVLMANAKEILSGASTFAYCAKLLNTNIPFENIKL
jgi:bacillopeptidase F (M6 metalloprotease family)